MASSKKNRTGKNKLRIILPVILFLAAAAFFLYTGIYYRADPSSAQALVSNEAAAVTETGFGWFFDGPGTEDALVFYPGGKVEETAYAPFLRLLAEGGLDVFLVRMPFRLAVFNANGADGVLSSYDYDRWYVGGHSLGGAMAAIYASRHEDIAGVILCAAYPTKPLADDILEVTVYGSEDGIVNRSRLVEGRKYSPGNSVEEEIPGGNHAQFGNYGVQSGDGKAAISAEQQQEQAAEIILRSILPSDADSP